MSTSFLLWTVALQAPLSWGTPGKNTGVRCRALLQGIFLTQGLNLHLLCLLHWQTHIHTEEEMLGEGKIKRETSRDVALFSRQLTTSKLVSLGLRSYRVCKDATNVTAQWPKQRKKTLSVSKFTDYSSEKKTTHCSEEMYLFKKLRRIQSQFLVLKIMLCIDCRRLSIH